MTMNWISVKDKLPEKNGDCLTYTPPQRPGWKGSIKIASFAKDLYDIDEYDFEGEHRAGWYELDSEYGYFEWIGITHWQTLPEPPKEDNP